jgi:hypothetical protein
MRALLAFSKTVAVFAFNVLNATWYQVQVVPLNPVNQNPVWFYVRSPMAFPIALERMIQICLWQWLFVDKH